MKFQLKKLSVLLFFAVVWILPAAKDRHFGWDSVLLIIGTFFSVLALHLAERRIVALLIVAVIFVLLGVYDFNYLFMSLLPFFLTCAHKEAVAVKQENDKKHKDERSNYSYVFAWLNFYCGIAVLIYGVVAYFNSTEKNTDTLIENIEFSWWMCVIFIFMAALSFKKQKDKKEKNKPKEKNRNLVNLRSIYILSVISYLEAVFCYWANNYNSSYITEIIFFPWFMYIASLIYDGDIIIDAIIKHTETFVTKLSVIDRVEK